MITQLKNHHFVTIILYLLLSHVLAFYRRVRDTDSEHCCPMSLHLFDRTIKERVTQPLPLLLAVLVLLTGCGQSEIESGADAVSGRRSQADHSVDSTFPRYGGHLRVGYNIAPTSLDAVLGRSGGDAYYWRQIFDQLVDVDPQLQPRPGTGRNP